MKHKPDTNSDFNYPPLTAEDFECLYHYYKYDGFTIGFNGIDHEVTIYFPMQGRADYNRFGFRIRIQVDTPSGEQGSAIPAIRDATAEIAEETIMKLIRFMSGRKKRG